MSELTLVLIRFAYLAILWIFVLSAISVVRSDMFGARVDSTPRADRKAERQSRRQRAAAKPAKRPRGAPTHVAIVEGANAGRDRLPRRGADPDRPRHRRRDPPRRRLRLHPARPHRQLRRPVVRRGPRLHQRHLHRLAPAHPAHHPPARQQGPHRQDHPRAAEVGHSARAPRPSRTARRADGPPGRRRLALRYAALSDVGRVRKDNQDSGYASPHLLVIADGVGGAARGDVASSTAVQALRRLDEPPGRRPARGAGRRDAPRPRPDRRARRAGPRARRHQHHRHRRALRRAPDRRRRTSATAAATCCATARCPSSPRTTPSCRASSTRAGSPRRSRASHPHRNLILRAVDGVHETDPDLFTLELAARRPAAAVQRRRVRRARPTTGSPTSSAPASVDYAVVELVRASLEAGSSDNVTCVVADVVDADAGRGPPTGARRRRGRRRGRRSRGAGARRASSAGTAVATPARSSRCPATPPPVRPAPTPRSCATPRARRAAAAGCAGVAVLVVLAAGARGGRRARLPLEPGPVLRRRRRRQGRDLPRRPGRHPRRHAHQVVETTDVTVAALPDFSAGSVEGGHRREVPARRAPDRRQTCPALRAVCPTTAPTPTPTAGTAVRPAPPAGPAPSEAPHAAEGGPLRRPRRRPVATASASPSPSPRRRCAPPDCIEAAT